jgi:metacaspase-1
MPCEDLQKAFNDKFGDIQRVLQAELHAIASDTEEKAQQIADDFENGHDLSEGVGAVAGTAIGAFAGGPAGAVVGEIIGKTIGSLFILEIGMKRESFSLDIPHTKMETQDFSYDLPFVELKDTDILFDLPTMEMRRVEGPPKPELTLSWDKGYPETVVRWTPTYLDIPVMVMRTQRIVVGLPQIEMKRQEFKMDIPAFKMVTTEFSADIPHITLRFIQDAGKQTASDASALSQAAQDLSAQKQIEYKHRLRVEVAPLATDMFACFRTQILNGRNTILSHFSAQIQTLQNAVTGIAANGVSADNPEHIKAVDALNAALAKQAEALQPLDEALLKLDEGAKTALAQFLGDENITRNRETFGKFSRIPSLVRYSTKAAKRGHYLTIGLNNFDPEAYGDTGALDGCENDARDMAALAHKVGFTGKTLLTKNATSSSVLLELANAASTLQPGDIFFLTFSGHGGQTGDITGDEQDDLDETWCLYDRQLIDDELYAMWAKFKPGVRILVLSDSCHSGTVTRSLFRNLHTRALSEAVRLDKELAKDFGEVNSRLKIRSIAGRPKAIPFSQSWEMYIKNKSMYDSLQLLSGTKDDLKASIGASVLLISGCQDNQLSLDGTTNGVFTEAVKHAWADGSFIGNYKDFWKAIVNRPMPPDQSPNYYVVGSLNMEFEAQRPFTI